MEAQIEKLAAHFNLNRYPIRWGTYKIGPFRTTYFGVLGFDVSVNFSPRKFW